MRSLARSRRGRCGPIGRCESSDLKLRAQWRPLRDHAEPCVRSPWNAANRESVAAKQSATQELRGKTDALAAATDGRVGRAQALQGRTNADGVQATGAEQFLACPVFQKVIR